MKGRTVQIDPEDLRDALLAVLAKPQPKPHPEVRQVPQPKDLATMEFDWDVLRLMVAAKMRRELRGERGVGVKSLSRMVDVADTSLGAFLRGERHTPTLRTAIRLMAWVGYTDFAEFLVDRDD